MTDQRSHPSSLRRYWQTRRHHGLEDVGDRIGQVAVAAAVADGCSGGCLTRNLIVGRAGLEAATNGLPTRRV